MLNTILMLTVLNQKPVIPVVETPIHGITYVMMPDGVLYCLPKGSRIQTCSYKTQEIIFNSGVVKPDGVFRTIQYKPYAPPKIKKCGVIYNPKDGKSYNYKC